MSLDERPVAATDGLRERHKSRRRAQILEAARALLREAPDAVVTTEQIAHRAEVVPATVYNLIGPRAELWRALAEAYMDRLEERLAAERAEDPVERLRRAVELTVELLVADPAVSRRMLRGWQGSGGLLRNRPGGPPPPAIWPSPAPLGPLRHVHDAMEAVRAAGLLRPDVDADGLAAVVGSTLLGALHQWSAGVIDDARCTQRALQGVDVALAAGAAPAHLERFAAALRSDARPGPGR